jgi:hypothetical protein
MSTAHYQKLPQANKFFIGTIPEPGEQEITLEAQFNPKELQIESPIKWTEHPAINAQSVATKPMEFTAMGAETMKVELIFDAFEDDSNEVVDKIATLKRMASVLHSVGGSNKRERNRSVDRERPNFCVATWGTQAPFRCVIESISVKYTMFSVDGTPVRATVVLGLKSGSRSLDNTSDETTFEKASRERAAARAKQVQEKAIVLKARAEADAKERAARYEASAADRRLAEREARVNEQQQQLQAERAQRRRDMAVIEARTAREQRVAEEERQLAAREQRKKDFELE